MDSSVDKTCPNTVGSNDLQGRIPRCFNVFDIPFRHGL